MGKRFYRLEHEYMQVAVAPFGGPIAITSDKSLILTVRAEDPSIENICLFSNDGEIYSKIRLDSSSTDVIVCM